MENAVPDAVRILDVVRQGSSLPLMLEDRAGNAWFVKATGSGHGVTGSVVEFLTGHLGIAAGVRIPSPNLIRIAPSLWESAGDLDPEILDLLRASEGLNLAFPYFAGRTEYSADRLAAVPEGDRLGVFLLDVLLLNVDRTRTNPNLFFVGDALYAVDFGSSMQMRAAVAGLDADAEAFLPEIKRHPFYREDYPGMLFAEKIPRLILGTLGQLRDAVPREWASALAQDGTGTAKCWTLLDGLFRNAPKILAERLTRLRAIEPEPEAAAVKRRLENRKRFEAKWRKDLMERNVMPAAGPGPT